jgi:two-component system response regulator AtoC
MKLPRKVLLIEDDTLLRERWENLLRDEGYYVIAVWNRSLALNCLGKEEIDIMLVEEEVLSENSFELLAFARQRFPDMVVVVTGREENPSRVRELLAKGVYEYLSPPFTSSRILSVIRRADDHLTLLEENKDLRRKFTHRFSFAGITGVSEKMQRIFNLILQVSQVKRPVLLVGEQGTGKEMVARAIHRYAFGEEKPFVRVLCGATLQGLFQGDILRVEEGTLYFEDVHLLALPFQAELLEFLEEHRFGGRGGNVRIIASSEVPLEEKVAQGAFRNDLYYFLSVIKIEIPPLRERKEDIPFLVDQFLRDIAEETGRGPVRIDREALKILIEYDWPGNVVELKNTLEGMVILSQSDVLTPEDIPEHIRRGNLLREGVIGIRLGTPLKEVEKLLIRETLKAHRFNKTRTAQALGISLRTLYRKIEEYHLDEETPQKT